MLRRREATKGIITQKEIETSHQDPVMMMMMMMMKMMKEKMKVIQKSPKIT